MFWSQKFNPSTDLEDLSGKVIIVTGGNKGIGYATVKHLARRGAKVYLGARTEEKGAGAIAKLKEEGIGSGDVVWLFCDLSTPALAKESGEAFLRKEERLDVLINNAAVLFEDPTKPSQDGICEVLMVNHVGTFQITKTLLPLLEKTSKEDSSDVRIVTLASALHRLPRATDPKLRFQSIEDFQLRYGTKSGFRSDLERYPVSKLANILFSNALQRHLDASSSSIISISLHPGMIDTFTGRLPFPRFVQRLTEMTLKHPDEGAYNSCFAAASPAVRKNPDRYRGAYLDPVGKVASTSKNGRNEALGDELWATTEKYLEGLNL